MGVEDLERATIPAWERARRALRAGDVETAERELDRAVARWRRLQEYSIEWIASLLSFIGRRLGEAAVEEALRGFGDAYLRPRLEVAPTPWTELPAEVRARAIIANMVANFGTCEVEEEPDAYVLRFRCGTGGRLIDEGRYEEDGGPYLVLREAAGRTFSRDALPVYCAHCAVNNEMQHIDWTGLPATVEEPPRGPGEVCVHRIYKDPTAVPREVLERLGYEPPG